MPEVIDPPPAEKIEVVDPPEKVAGKTNFGDKFRSALAEAGGPSDPAKESSPEKPPAEEKVVAKEEKAAKGKAVEAKKPSALDLALGEEKPPEDKKPDTATEKAAALKEFEEAEKSKDWRIARPILEARLKREEELTAEVNRLKGDLGKVDSKLPETLELTAKERDELKKQNDELKDVVTKINVEYSADYQEKFVKGRVKLVERAVTRVKEFGGDVDKFSDALELKGRHRTAALKEALENVDPIDQPRIISVLDQISALDDEAAELKKNPQHAFEELESKRTAERQKQTAEHERLIKAEFEKVDHALRTKSPLLRTVDPTTEGGAEWNDQVKAAFAEADKLFAPDAQLADQREAAVMRQRYPALEKMLLETRKELKEANGRLREYDEASPDFKGHKQPETKVKLTPAEKYHKALDEARGGSDDGV